MAPLVVTLYQQMPEPKWVIAMGNCTVTGGIFMRSPTCVSGMDRVMPVDIYLTGCPPTPEALFHSLLELRSKVIAKEKHRERAAQIQLKDMVVPRPQSSSEQTDALGRWNLPMGKARF